MKDQREIIIPDLDYQAEVRKCKTMEDVVGKNGLMQKLFNYPTIARSRNGRTSGKRKT